MTSAHESLKCAPMKTDILEDIQRRGESNLAAIKTHHDIQSGKRGSFANNGKKNEARGCVGPKRKKVKAHEIPVLPKSKTIGKPIITDGTKGYKRDRITGSITRCVSA